MGLIPALVAALAFGASSNLPAQAPPAPQSPQELVNAMTARERDAVEHRQRFAYMSIERSDRTDGHLWTERVVETAQGRVRLLLAEDGRPLSPERARAERAKLDDVLARTDEFMRREQSARSDEVHAREMLGKLPGGFILENVRLQGGLWRIEYRPDPSYDPSGIEDHILHSMRGWFTMDARQLRLVHIEGRLPEDLALGFGLVNIKAGSNFSLDKQEAEGSWRAAHSVVDIRGRALLFKTITHSTEFTHSEFHKVPQDLTLAQAVAMLER